MDRAVIPLHPMLLRQLRRLGLAPDAPPADAQRWATLLQLVDRAYRESDQLVALVTRSERLVTDELASSQRALSDAQRLAGLGSWSLVPGTDTALVSDELARLFDLPGGSQPVTLDCMIDTVREQDRERVRRVIGAAQAGPIRRTGELGFVTESGQALWCLCRIESRADANGQVTRIDGTVLDITERRDAEERSRELTRTDPLTGLANRAHFFQVLQAALEAESARASGLAVIFVDLDGFKDINDELGHRAGDELLTTIAKRLRACLRASDIVARFGSDEFVLLLRGMPSRAEAATVAAKVLQACTASVGDTVCASVVTASVGVATHPGDGETAEELVSHADAAMQRAKETGRNRVCLFGTEPEPRRDDGWMARALRSALANGELQVVYQPIVDGTSGRVLGVEALSRWQHATRGAISPAEFIPVAERCGLIDALCWQVGRTACRQIAQWDAMGLPALFLSLNVSPLQLQSQSFVDHVQELLADTGLDPRRLHLEITEDGLMRDPIFAAQLLSQLHAVGVRISLDDFGTGRSSLAYLRQLPVHCIKIDRSFVREITGPHVGPILEGVITIATSLGCELVAEGVETETQRDALLRARCVQMQGYLFARPARAEDLTLLLGAGQLVDVLDAAAPLPDGAVRQLH